MSNDLNQCNFIGRLGRDPECRYLSNGNAVANFSIACGWKSKDKEGAEWVNIVAFGKLGEICGEYLKKGSRVFISGKMRTQKWEDQSGVTKYKTEIVANDMKMLDSKSDQPAQQQAPQQGQSYQQQAPAQQPDSFEDSIPF